METIFINSEDTMASEPNSFILNLVDKICFIKLSPWKNIKKPYKSIKFDISALISNDELEVLSRFSFSFTLEV